MNDLFNTPEMWPDNLRDLINDFNESNQDYQDLRKLLDLCRRIGFTFDFGLDCVPSNLQKIDKPLFSIHSFKALESRCFSAYRANIENTPEKLELAKNLYPSSDFYIEFHNSPISLQVVYGG
jgi:hypothetical protein